MKQKTIKNLLVVVVIIAVTGLSSWVSTTTQATMIDEKK